MSEKVRQHGRRHVLLLYQNSMDQIWPASLFFGLGLMALWFFADRFLPNLNQVQDTVLFAGGIVILAIAAFAIIARKGGYVQAFSDHFRLVTPFLRLKIAYRRVAGTRASQLRALYPPEKARLFERGALQPFYALTVVEVDLKEYPLALHTMRLFLSKPYFPQGKVGFVLLVEDWLSLIQDLDHFSLQWRQSQLKQTTRPTSGTRSLGNFPKR